MRGGVWDVEVLRRCSLLGCLGYTSPAVVAATEWLGSHFKLSFEFSNSAVRDDHVSDDENVPWQLGNYSRMLNRGFIALLVEYLSELQSGCFSGKYDREIRVARLR